MKKLYLVVGLLLIVALVIGSLSCAKPAPPTTPTLTPSPTPTPTSPAKPIKIGAIAPLSGFAASDGKRIIQGMQLALDEVNYEVAGRKIELLVEDDAWDTAVGVAKGKKLVLSDGVSVLLPYVGTIIEGLRDFFHENKIITISTQGGTWALAEQRWSKYFFRSAYSPAQETRVQGYVAYTKKGYRTAVTMTSDFPAGHENADGFKLVFEKLGGKVIQEIWTPMGAIDFAPYLAKVDTKANMLWAFYFGADAIRFVKQYAEYGLKDKVTPFLYGSCVDSDYLPAQGDAALGIEDVFMYSNILNTPENTRFRQAFAAKFKGEEGSLYSEHGYVAIKMLLLGLQAVKGKVEDTDALIAALEKVKFEAPRGPLRFDEKHHPVQNIYQRKVEKVAGKLQNTVVDTYPDVGLYWLPPGVK